MGSRMGNGGETTTLVLMPAGGALEGEAFDTIRMPMLAATDTSPGLASVPALERQVAGWGQQDAPPRPARRSLPVQEAAAEAAVQPPALWRRCFCFGWPLLADVGGDR